MEEINILFANKLQKLRKEKDIKQEVVAKELKITQQAYSKLERGATNFSSKIISKICAYFKITIYAFLNSGNQIDLAKEIALLQELLLSKEENITGLKKQIELLESILKSKTESAGKTKNIAN